MTFQVLAEDPKYRLKVIRVRGRKVTTLASFAISVGHQGMSATKAFEQADLVEFRILRAFIVLGVPVILVVGFALLRARWFRPDSF